MSLAGSYRKSLREKVPSSRCDLSFTGICGAMPFSSTSQFSIEAAPVGGIADKPLRLETKALLCSLEHGLRRADLGLANGAGCLHVNDDAELHVDEIVVGVSEERWPLVSPGPLRRRIGRRDELRDDVAGGAPCRIVKGR